MARYIDIDKLLVALRIENATNEEIDAFEFEYDIKDICKEIINSVPIADVAPVRHGKWISDSNWLNVKCSCCNKSVPTDLISFAKKYCPKCGAKMDLE